MRPLLVILSAVLIMGGLLTTAVGWKRGNNTLEFRGWIAVVIGILVLLKLFP